MIDALLDNMLAAKDKEVNTFMEMLPFIIFGIIWLFGFIAKAANSAKKNKQPQLPVKPGEHKVQSAKKPTDLAGVIKLIKERYKDAMEEANMRTGKPSPRQPHAAIPHKSSQMQQPEPISQFQKQQVKPGLFQSQPKVMHPMYEYTIEEPKQEPVKPAVKQPTPPEVMKKKLEPRKAEKIIHTGPQSFIEELTAQYTESDGLRKAILHSEILGKPTALRDQTF